MRASSRALFTTMSFPSSPSNLSTSSFVRWPLCIATLLRHYVLWSRSKAMSRVLAKCVPDTLCAFLREIPPRQGYNPCPERPANRRDNADGFYDESDDHRPDREPLR